MTQNPSERALIIQFLFVISVVVATPVVCYEVFAWLLDKHKCRESDARDYDIGLGIQLTFKGLACFLLVATILSCFMYQPLGLSTIPAAFQTAMMGMWLWEWAFIIPALFAAINRERPKVIQGMMIVAAIVCVISLAFLSQMVRGY